jgi:SWI/SNF-related matrix-associated actin-dependent regulator of chromatin subfamily A3
MGLGKTITCVSLIAATLDSARAFAAGSIDPFPAPPDINSLLESFDGVSGSYESAKGKAKAARAQEKFEAEYARASRIKVKCRASLIVCPLSTVSNWEDQFREHWKGPVSVLGGGSGACINPTLPSFFAKVTDEKSVARKARIREGTPLRLYVYHGNARRPDPKFLADFDVVITTYATLASEYSKQIRCIAGRDEEDEGDSSDGISLIEVDEHGNPILKPAKPKKNVLKRKKSSLGICNGTDSASPLQSIHWFRVVLDEAQ